MSAEIINGLTGLTDQQVLDGISRGDIHPNSRTVAQHRGLSPQEIFRHLPEARFAVGALFAISDEKLIKLERIQAKISARFKLQKTQA